MRKELNKFTKLSFSKSDLDIYIIRSAILDALNEFLPFFKGRLLDIGCGKMPYRNYILQRSSVSDYVGIDLEGAKVYDVNISPDLTWDGLKLPFIDDEFNTIILTEVLEHVPSPIMTLTESHRVLKVDGLIFFTIPFLWPLHEVPHDECRYTPFALERLLKQAGFSNIEIKATGGWHASMAQMLGLWVRRSNMSNGKRKFLSCILKPVMKYLIFKDRKPDLFREGQMITGLYGIARK